MLYLIGDILWQKWVLIHSRMIPKFHGRTFKVPLFKKSNYEQISNDNVDDDDEK